MIGTRFYKSNYDQEKYTEAAIWCNENNAMITDKGEYYEVEKIPDPTEEELKERVIAVRDQYFDKYVDWYQGKPLLWAELSEEERTNRENYRIYLRDYNDTEGWWKQNPMTYEEWLLSQSK